MSITRSHCCRSLPCRRTSDKPSQFFCDRTDCPRKVFAQRIDGIARYYWRKTTRLDDLRRLTWPIGPAARIARLASLIFSLDAVLYCFTDLCMKAQRS